MVWKLTVRKKKEDGKKKSGLEQSLKTKTKLTQVSERYAMMKALRAMLNPEEELEASKILKAQVIATQGLGEVGDKNRPSNVALEGYEELIQFHAMDEFAYGKDSEITKTDSIVLVGVLANFFNRCIRREHTDAEMLVLPPEFWMSDYTRRAGRESSLEK